MPLSEPGWWYESAPGWQARLLAPAAHVYGALSAARMSRLPCYRSRLPVICIGNFTAGGSGKTPLSIAVARLVQSLHKSPVFLSRGYGGSSAGPLTVDRAVSFPSEVGDEPLLLAREGMTVVARDRSAGARYIEGKAPPGSVIIMDDGLQNPTLRKDYVIAAIDSERLLGNGRCIPAGPLRAPIEKQLALTDAVFIAGSEPSAAHALLDSLSFKGLRLHGHLTPAGDTGWLQGARVLAFAGIANPKRFFDLVTRLGASVAGERVFADHHFLSQREAAVLLAEAESEGAMLVTTAKDAARLEGTDGPCASLLEKVRVVAVTMSFDRERESDSVLAEALRLRISRP